MTNEPNSSYATAPQKGRGEQLRPAAGASLAASPNESINILIVDDEPKNLAVLETLLDDPAYRLVRAESANEALLALVVEEFALLILDIRMPGMTGFELAQMIKDRKKTAQVPIIFLSAYYNEDQHVLEGYNTGAVDYLHKPVNPVILRSKVAVFAELHRKNRESVLTSRALLAEITERRRAEEQLRELNENLEQRVADRTEALRESEARLAAALDGGGMGLWEWDLGSERSIWNATEYQILGLPVGSQIVPVNLFFDRVHPDDVDEFNQILTNAVKHGSAFHHEVRIKRADTGEIRWLAAAGRPGRDANGQVVKLVGVNYDVTGRRRVEDSLRRSQEQYHTLFSTLLEAFCIIEMLFDETGRPVDYRLLEVNPAFARHTGLTNAEGKRIRELVPELDAHWFEIYGKVALTGHPVRFVQEAKALNRWYDSSAYQVGNPEDRHVAILFTDITEQKRVESELKKSKASAESAMKQAEQANRAKDHFLAVLSHELRTPLAPVRMAISVWERQMDTLPPELQHDLAMIRRNVDLECRLIDDLLDLNRIIRGKLDLQFSLVDLHEEVAHALRIIGGEALAKNVTVSSEARAATAHVMADAARLQQILWNLLKNAIKFTPQGGSVSVRTYNKPQGSVCVEVSDTGAGIESSAIDQIFNAFEQGGTQVTRQFGGMGLGLTISRAIATMHSGKLTAHSDGKGKGATFTLELTHAQPTEIAPADTIPRSTEYLAMLPQTRQESLRILLVEDHSDTARLLTRILYSKGYTVKTTSNVAEALFAAEGQAFDLIISDVGLPDGTGYDLLRQLIARRPTKAIALSGYGMEEDIQMSRDAGFAMHLTKPVNLDQLDLGIQTLTRTDSRVQEVT